ESTPQVEIELPGQNTTPDGRPVEVLPAPDLPAEPDPAAPSDESETQSSGAPSVVLASMKTAAAEPSTSAANSNALLIKAREESWVEWKRPDGTVLVSRLFDGGSEISFPLRG